MFRFSIRELVLLTLVVAMGVGWWLHHRVWVERFSAKAYDSDIWQSRTEELQARVELLAEQLREAPKNLPSD
ncbi:MAG: hypothetical protein L0211_14155 [Planctomycetaceae bacterium]|nr:hypothetical protein [Planctomycetaceae bacterium]